MIMTTERPAPPKLLLTSKEASTALGISPRKLWELTAGRQIASVRIGRSVRYDVRDLEAYIDDNKKSVRR